MNSKTTEETNKILSIPVKLDPNFFFNYRKEEKRFQNGIIKIHVVQTWHCRAFPTHIYPTAPLPPLDPPVTMKDQNLNNVNIQWRMSTNSLFAALIQSTLSVLYKVRW